MLEDISKLCGDSADLVKRTINIGINKIDIIYSEALCSSSFIADFVLKPLSEIIIEENSSGNFYLLVKNSLTGSSCKELTDLNMAIEMLFLGSTIIIINNKEIISIETRASLDRGISSSSIEVAITGPKDSFTENFVKNLGLIRKRIRNNNLHVKALKLGSQSNTRVGICYMNNIVEKSLVESVFKRLEEINNDYDKPILFVIDEANTIFNSRKYKEFDFDFLRTLTHNRHKRKMIYCLTQDEPIPNFV